MTATTLVLDKTTVAHRIAMRYAGNNRVDYAGARSAIEQALELYDEAGEPRQLREVIVALADMLDYEFGPNVGPFAEDWIENTVNASRERIA